MNYNYLTDVKFAVTDTKLFKFPNVVKLELVNELGNVVSFLVKCLCIDTN